MADDAKTMYEHIGQFLEHVNNLCSLQLVYFLTSKIDRFLG
jgi:hypothetical protein